MIEKIKLIVSDIDGVWTDGSFYYDANGDALRKFSTKDSYGVSLCRLANIPLLILSGEKSDIVQKRLLKLGIDNFRLGTDNKLEYLSSYCSNHNINMSDVAYLGDDMNDFNLIDQVGIFACPADAYIKVKERSHLVLKTSGGNGVFREFVETVLEGKGILENVYKLYLAK